jgi:DNA-directed RNA polymerase specialized sigma24 family protein
MPAEQKRKARVEVERAQREYEREVDTSRAARRKSFAQAQKAGLSLREIGEAVGLHHSSVADIIHGD